MASSYEVPVSPWKVPSFIYLFGCQPLHLECCGELIFKDISMLVNLKSILWCWRLVSWHGWHPRDIAFPFLCSQNGSVIAEPARGDSWSIQLFTPATAPRGFPGNKTMQVSVLTLKWDGLYQINGQACAVALFSSLVLRYCISIKICPALFEALSEPRELTYLRTTGGGWVDKQHSDICSTPSTLIVFVIQLCQFKS